MRRSKPIVVLFVLSLVLAGCWAKVIDKFSEIQGEVIDPDGGEVDGLVVSIAGKTEQTATGGTFVISDVPYGNHVLKITRDGSVLYEQSIQVNDEITVLVITLGEKAVPNLLENPGFEIPHPDFPDTRAAAWGGNAWANNGITSAEVARTGEKGVKIVSDTETGRYITQVVDIEGGKTYELSAWMKGKTGSARMKMEFYKDQTNAAGYVGGKDSNVFAPTGEWTKITMHADAPAEANRVMVYLRLVNAPGEIHYDDANFISLD